MVVQHKQHGQSSSSSYIKPAATAAANQRMHAGREARRTVGSFTMPPGTMVARAADFPNVVGIDSGSARRRVCRKCNQPSCRKHHSAKQIVFDL